MKAPNNNLIHLGVIGLVSITLFQPPAGYAAPGIINHQGRIAVGGANFDGTGHFKFALVDTGGVETFWSNDGTSEGGAEPIAATAVLVVKGHYAVGLGATSPIPAGVFADSDDVWLRVWFSQTGAGGSFELLSPDRRIASTGYALSASEAGRIGGMTAEEVVDRASEGAWRVGAVSSTSLDLVASVLASDLPDPALDQGREIAYHSGHVYIVSPAEDALTVFDVSDPRDPQLRRVIADSDAGIDGLDGAVDVAVSDGHAFVVSFEEDSLAVFDLADPASPQLVSVLKHSDPGVDGLQGPRALDVQAGVAVVVSVANSTMAVFDVSDPSNPVLGAVVRDSDPGIGTLSGAIDVSISMGHAHVVAREDGTLMTFDVSVPASPVLRSLLVNPGGITRLTSVEVADGVALIGGVDPGSQVAAVDVSDPTAPLYRSSVSVSGFPRDIVFDGSLAFVCGEIVGSSRLDLLEITNLSNLQRIDEVEDSNLPSSQSVVAHQGFIISAGTDFGFDDGALAVHEILPALSSGGLVGIGTESPDYDLHVDGDALITGSLRDSRSVAGSFGQILSSTGSGTAWIDFNPEQFLLKDGSEPVTGSLDVSGMLDVGSDSSISGNLEVSGLLDADSDAGIGGDLFVSGSTQATSFEFVAPKIFTHNISANTMVPADETETYRRRETGGIYAAAGNNVLSLFAPLHLPQGADIQSITARYYDNDAGAKFTDFFGRVRRRPITAASNENIGVFDPATVADVTTTTLQELPASLVAGKTVIDNDTYEYWLFLKSTVSTATSNLRLYGIEVKYTLSTLNP